MEKQEVKIPDTKYDLKIISDDYTTRIWIHEKIESTSFDYGANDAVEWGLDDVGMFYIETRDGILYLEDDDVIPEVDIVKQYYIDSNIYEIEGVVMNFLLEKELYGDDIKGTIVDLRDNRCSD